MKPTSALITDDESEAVGQTRRIRQILIGGDEVREEDIHRFPAALLHVLCQAATAP